MRIGVFDSGIGGLTVLRELRRHCPGHSTLYLGDTARVPYGSKSPETIKRYSLCNADFLLREGIDYLVVACNTASAFALGDLSELPIPVTGVIEPGARLAAQFVTDGVVGVLGTSGTVRSGAYPRAVRSINPALRVDSIACPMFVPLVEEGWEESQAEIAREAAHVYLAPWLEGRREKPKAVILGCTHYPLLKPILQETLGEDVRLIDSAEAVALHVQEQLSKSASREDARSHRLFLTDASEGFVRFAERFFGESAGLPSLSIELVDLDPVVES